MTELIAARPARRCIPSPPTDTNAPAPTGESPYRRSHTTWSTTRDVTSTAIDERSPVIPAASAAHPTTTTDSSHFPRINPETPCNPGIRQPKHGHATSDPASEPRNRPAAPEYQPQHPSTHPSTTPRITLEPDPRTRPGQRLWACFAAAREISWPRTSSPTDEDTRTSLRTGPWLSTATRYCQIPNIGHSTVETRYGNEY